MGFKDGTCEEFCALMKRIRVCDSNTNRLTQYKFTVNGQSLVRALIRTPTTRGLNEENEQGAGGALPNGCSLSRSYRHTTRLVPPSGSAEEIPSPTGLRSP